MKNSNSRCGGSVPATSVFLPTSIPSEYEAAG